MCPGLSAENLGCRAKTGAAKERTYRRGRAAESRRGALRASSEGFATPLWVSSTGRVRRLCDYTSSWVRFGVTEGSPDRIHGEGGSKDDPTVIVIGISSGLAVPGLVQIRGWTGWKRLDSLGCGLELSELQLFGRSSLRFPLTMSTCQTVSSLCLLVQSFSITAHRQIFFHHRRNGGQLPPYRCLKQIYWAATSLKQRTGYTTADQSTSPVRPLRATATTVILAPSRCRIPVAPPLPAAIRMLPNLPRSFCLIGSQIF